METSKEKYALLDKLGMCHRCQKAPMFPGYKFCADCIEKFTNYNITHYDSEKAKAYQSRRRELYEQNKAEGICIRCSKKATHGLYCYECSIKAKKRNAQTAARRKRERAERGLIPKIRKEQGLCQRCGKPIDDIERSKYYCGACCDEMREASYLADKTLWRIKNSQIYKNSEPISDVRLYKDLQKKKGKSNDKR